jgi:predicted HTH transcriptional regulator
MGAIDMTVEAWGTGLQRIQSAAKEYGLPDVEFIEMPESFRVNLYRSSLPIVFTDG